LTLIKSVNEQALMPTVTLISQIQKGQDLVLQ
jgi:hypothetical protein